MNAQVYNIWRKLKGLSNLGVDSHLGSWENHKTRLLNQFMLIASVASGVLATYHIVLFQFYIPLLFAFSYFTFNVVIFYLHFRAKYRLARVVAILGYAAIFFINMLLAGKALHVEYIMLALIIVSLFFFQERWLQISMLSVVLVLFFAGHFLLDHLIAPSFAEYVGSHDYLLVYFTAAICLIFALNPFLEEILKNQAEKEKLVNDLIRSNTELKRFNYMVSHDLKAPLRNIISFATLAKRKSPDAKEYSELAEYLNYIDDNARHINQLSEDLLSLADLENKPPELRSCSLKGLLEQVSSRFQDIDNACITLEMADHDIEVYANPSLLGVVLQNLIENGIKYNKSLSREIQIKSYRHNGEVWIAVKDNGIGVPQDMEAYIFEPFKRLHGGQYPGTGLGLAITKKIIDFHGGHIKVSSSTAGSTFLIILPQSIESVLTKNRAAALSANSRFKRTKVSSLASKANHG